MDNKALCPTFDEGKILTLEEDPICGPECGDIPEPIMVIKEPHFNYMDKEKIKSPTSDPLPYQRINHFMKALSRFQTEDTIEVPPKVYEAILRQFKAKGITKLESDSIRKCLSEISPLSP